MLAATTWRLRKAEQEVAEILSGVDRYVDMGVRLLVVRQAREGEEGASLLKAKPDLRFVVIREHRLGGVLDTELGEFVTPSESPVTWLCSEQTEDLILHRDDLPLRLCVEGAMGAGKSTLGVQWCLLRALEHSGTGAEIGVLAPTTSRLQEVIRTFRDLMPATWGEWRERDQTYTLVNGVVLRFLSTHEASREEGSRIQGYSFVACLSDEGQDSLGVDGDVEARGRDAPRGAYKRLVTTTVKDSPAYRSWRDRVSRTTHPISNVPLWGLYRLRGTDSPFVPVDYWIQLRATMAEREYLRKVEALDLPSESRVYSSWSREHNLWPIPLGATNVTARELGRHHDAYCSVLVGFDPGVAQDSSVILRAYEIAERDERGQLVYRIVWYVEAELITQGGTTETHARKLYELLRDRFGCYRPGRNGRVDPDSPVALIRADPYSRGKENDQAHPDISVYQTFRRLGMIIKPAAYKVGSTDPAQIPREGRIELVQSLLCSYSGERRLYVHCDDRRQPVAPRLVEAFESQERDGNGHPERGRDGRKRKETDYSDLTAALGYAVFGVESRRLADASQGVRR